MKLILLITLSLFSISTCICQSHDPNKHTKLDSLKNKQKDLAIINSKVIELSKSTTKVRVLETCSTGSNLCGVFAFGSSSIVSVESGKYKGDTLIIAALCKSTGYTINKIYLLQMSTTPDFEVILCNNKSYLPSWNINLDKNKYLLFFGLLKSEFK